jgi:hypothetical protein
MIIREEILNKIRPFYQQDLIKVITGIRRCGKSVLLKQIIENANVPVITGLGGVIKWDNTLTWEDKSYTDSWHYDVKDAITFKNIDNLKIDNFIFRSDKNNENILTWSGLVIDSCNNVKITNSEITGFNWIGLVLKSSTNVNVNSSKLYENRYGIYDNSNYSIISDNIISGLFSESEEYETYGAWVSNSDHDSRYYDGIIEYGNNAIISNNEIYDNGQSGVYSNSCADATIVGNNIFNNWNDGIDIGAVSNETEITRATINNNNVMNNKKHQINLIGTNHSNVTNNNVTISDEDNTYYGIILTRSDTAYNNVSYNKIFITANNSNRGVSVDNYIHDNKFIFNDIVAPIIYNAKPSSNYFLEITQNLTDPVGSLHEYILTNIGVGETKTADLSNLTLPNNKGYLISVVGTNNMWNALALFYPVGSGGGGTSLVVLSNNNLTLSLSGTTLSITNTNATFSTSVHVNIAGHI